MRVPRRAQSQPSGPGCRERDDPLLVVESGQGFPGDRRRARRQGRVPVADGSEVLERARSRSHQVRFRLGLYRSSGCVHGRDRGWLALA